MDTQWRERWQRNLVLTGKDESCYQEQHQRGPHARPDPSRGTCCLPRRRRHELTRYYSTVYPAITQLTLARRWWSGRDERITRWDGDVAYPSGATSGARMREGVEVRERSPDLPRGRSGCEVRSRETPKRGIFGTRDERTDRGRVCLQGRGP